MPGLGPGEEGAPRGIAFVKSTMTEAGCETLAELWREGVAEWTADAC